MHNMITIWVNKDDFHEFVLKRKDLYGQEFIGCECRTKPPVDGEYVQILISYDEYTQLEDRGVL